MWSFSPKSWEYLGFWVKQVIISASISNTEKLLVAKQVYLNQRLEVILHSGGLARPSTLKHLPRPSEAST